MTKIGMTRDGGRTRARPARKGMIPQLLLISGILSSLLYVAMNVFVPMQWEGYSTASQTISELSAIGAPTRSLWVLLGAIYTVLVGLFGWGVWVSAGRNRPLRIVGSLLIAYGFIGLFWPPMHQREVLAAGGETLTDTMHIVWTVATVLFMMLAIGFGAAAFGRRFRLYSVATLALLVAFGVLTGLDVPRIEANLPTPWVGVWERLNVGVFLFWVVMLAVTLLRRRDVRRATAAPMTATHVEGFVAPGFEEVRRSRVRIT